MKYLRSWGKFYPYLVQGLIQIGAVITTLLEVLKTSIGLPVAIFVLAAVEIIGVSEGLWFLHDTQSQNFGAFALVLLNTIIDSMIVNIEHEGKFDHTKKQAFSLRLVAVDLAYFLGFGQIKIKGITIGKKWKKRNISPAQRFIKIRAIITFTVFFLALSGRVNGLLTQTLNIPAKDGAVLLIETTDLTNVMAWLGGTLFTIFALFTMQALTEYSAQQVILVRADLKRRIQNAKAAETRKENARVKHLAQVDTVDAYNITKIRNNAIKPIRDESEERGTQTYQCPKCGKWMTKAGWYKHLSTQCLASEVYEINHDIEDELIKSNGHI